MEQIPQTKPSIEKRWLQNYDDSKVIEQKPVGTMYDYIYSKNIESMNNIAFNFMGTTITYEEFFENVAKVAKKFKALGVKEGDVIPLIMANIPESAYCFYALNYLGAVALMVDPRLNAYGLNRDINLCHPTTIVSITNACKELKKAKDIKEIRNIVMLSAVNSAKNPIIRGLMNVIDIKNGNAIPRNYMNWNKFLGLKDAKLEKEESKNFEGKPATIIFTGGTTGVHKGVLLSNDAINMTVHEHRYLIDDVERGERFLDILPPFIAYGLTSLHLSLSYGLETVLDPISDPKAFASKIKELQPSIVFGGPIHWEALARSKDLKAGDLSCLKFPVSGGEKLYPETASKINDALGRYGSKVGIFDGYGTSECCGVFSLNYAGKNTPGPVGYPLRFNEMCILDPESLEEKDYNEMGEICLNGPSLMNGYYQNDEETKKAFITDKYGRRWLRTGDLGTINDKGELIITGRSKRIFVCGVNKIYPPELEALISQIKGVNKCVVTGVNDPVLRTVPKVHIRLEEDNTKNTSEIIEEIERIITEKVGIEALPHYYDFSGVFKYTGSGKIDYIKMAEEDNKIVQEEQKKLKKVK